MNTAIRSAIVTAFYSCLALGAAANATASGINGINANQMPNRISMNVTVPKQTQGASFGEKVQSGLHAAGGILATGVALVIECGTEACVVALPDGSGYRADLGSMTVQSLDAARGIALRKAGGGAALLGGALPGGSILSAAVSSVSSLAGGSGSGAAAASYAATGRSAPTRELVGNKRDDGNIDVSEPLADGDYVLSVVVEKATSGLKDTLKTQVRLATPANAPNAVPASAPARAASTRVRMRLVFGVADGVLRARPESAQNSVTDAN